MPNAPIPLFKVFMADGAHAALKPVLESGRLAGGPQVAQFESRLAAWLGAPDAVALSDASAALTLALYLAGVRPGDEVIASPLACSATLMPIANLFARPAWCDIDPLTGMPAVEHIAERITERTRAILLYHWSGDVGDTAALAALAKRHGIPLIEDASEAFGALAQSRPMGCTADFTVYSFYATKHLNTGEGAALLAAAPDDLKYARQLRRFGIDYATFRLPNGDLNPHFDIPLAGFNFTMNEIAATLGLEQLRHIDPLLARHRDNGAFYESALADIPGLTRLKRREDGVSGWWTYALRAERRDDLVRKLTARGIGAQRLHLRNDGYTCFGGEKAGLPGVALFDEQNLSLPCGWWVSDSDRERVAGCLREGW